MRFTALSLARHGGLPLFSDHSVMPKPCSLNQRFSPNSTFCHALALRWHLCQGVKPSPLFLPCLPSEDQLVCHWERFGKASRDPLLQPMWGTRPCWGGPILQRIQFKDTQRAARPPTEDPSNSWQLGACVALGDPLASCLLLASVHQPSEGRKHLQEPACLAPHSGSLPSSLPPPDLPYPAPFFPQDAPLSPPCH